MTQRRLQLPPHIAAEMDPDELADAQIRLRTVETMPKHSVALRGKRHRISSTIDGNTLALLDHIVAHKQALHAARVQRGEADARLIPSRMSVIAEMIERDALDCVGVLRAAALEYLDAEGWCECGSPSRRDDGGYHDGEGWWCGECAAMAAEEAGR